MTKIVLVLGSGGREHALAWKIAESPLVSKVFVGPGNGGTMNESKVENANIGMGADQVIPFCRQNKVELVVVGPEVPLVDGIADELQKANILCFGPSKRAALLEGSKAFSKAFMMKHGIPTAEYCAFTNYKEACNYVEDVTKKYQVVIKASGLAAGKGVILPETLEEALDALKLIMVDKEFGEEAGKEVVIEERLEGPEVSVFAFSDGTQVHLLPASQDHKRIFDGDKGPNTGGMGAYTPTPIFTSDLESNVKNSIVIPTVKGAKEDGFPFIGLLFCGLMLTSKGFKVLEYNVRFGDPETESVLMLLESDLYKILHACASGALDKVQPIVCGQSLHKYACTVVAASQGYPGSYPKGKVITGVEEAEALSRNIKVFHAGTKHENGQLVTSGGRVLTVSARSGESLEKAVALAYEGLAKIKFEGMQFRKDIAYRALNSNKKKEHKPVDNKAAMVLGAGIAVMVAFTLAKVLRN